MRTDRTDANRDTRATGTGVLVIPDDAMVIVPVRNVVLFPGMILPLTIGREQSILAAQQAVPILPMAFSGSGQEVFGCWKRLTQRSVRG